ncbi:trypsin-like peptidase domain-containing protein [Pseudomonas sp. Z5-35]|uniref:trypsin-like serine peptidase n=1 Tax=unclassified Pseudomonas TaxID=196821 RepID=UPI003DA8F6BA
MKTTALFLFGALCSIAIHGTAHSKDYGEHLQNFTDSILLENADGTRNHWTGIGRLTTHNCTATLLDTRDASVTGHTPAYVLTAGHCIELTYGNIVTDRPEWGVLRFNLFSDTATKDYTMKTVAWRSMHGVDLAIIELEDTLQTLIQDAIQPLKLARQLPASGTDVLTVTAPRGFFNQETFASTLRMAACTLQPAKEVVANRWVWRSTLMTRCKDIAGGSSGGPVLDRHSNEIVGIVNITLKAQDLSSTCRTNAPCTPIDGVYRATPGDVFGIPTGFLNDCFEQGRLIDHGTLSCALFPAFTIISADQDKPTKLQKPNRHEDGTLETPTWDYRFSIDTPFYRYATVRTAKDCEKPRKYSGAINAKNAQGAKDAFIDTPIGTEPGYYFLCIIGVDSPAQRPSIGLMSNALSLPVQILGGAPATKPALSFQGLTVSLASNEEPDRIYVYKFGPPDTTDCSKKEGYNFAPTLFVEMAGTPLPIKFCSVARDRSGNESEPRIDLLSASTSQPLYSLQTEH